MPVGHQMAKLLFQRSVYILGTVFAGRQAQPAGIYLMRKRRRQPNLLLLKLCIGGFRGF